MESATDAAKRLYKIEQSGYDIDWHEQWIEKATAIIEARDGEWLAIVGEASITREPTLRQQYRDGGADGDACVQRSNIQHQSDTPRIFRNT